MSKEELIKLVGEQITNKRIEKQTIGSHLAENYKANDRTESDFSEMGKMLSVVEKINADREAEDQFDCLCKAIIYSIALFEARKRKIDISKVREEFDIEDLMKRYGGE